MKCLQCGSSDITKDGSLEGRAHIRVRFHDNPDAFLLTGSRDYRVCAAVCTKCGFIMNTVSQDDLRTLRQKFEYDES